MITVQSAPGHRITATQGTNGTISPVEGVLNSVGVLTVNETSNAAFTIEPNIGYSIDTVTVDEATVSPPIDEADRKYEVDSATGIGTYTFRNVMRDHTITATFKALPYITVSAGTGGTMAAISGGTLTSGKLYLPGKSTDAAFTITPDAGYIIKELRADNVLVQASDGPDSPYTIDGSGVGTYTFKDANENHTLAATFEDAIQLSSQSVNFGNFYMKNFMAQTKTVTVYNNGYMPVNVTPPNISEIKINGTATDAAIFGVSAGSYQQTIPAKDSATFEVTAQGNLPLGEYACKLLIPVASRTFTLPVTLNSYHRIYNVSFDHGKLYSYNEINRDNRFEIPHGGYLDFDGMAPGNKFQTYNVTYYTIDPGYRLTDIDASFVDPNGVEHRMDSLPKGQLINGLNRYYTALFADDQGDVYKGYEAYGQGDIYIYATFAALQYDFTQTQAIPAGAKVEITSVSNGGATLNDFDIASIDAFSDVTFTVTPPRGQHVSALSDSGNAVDTSEFSVDANGKAVYITKNITASHQIVPDFVPNEFTVSFDANGGTASYNSLPVTFGDRYGDLSDTNQLPTAIHPEGYTFGGWWTKADGKEIAADYEVVDGNAIVDVGYAHTLYAKWIVPPPPEPPLLKDDETGITAETDEGVLPEGTTLVVLPVTLGASDAIGSEKYGVAKDILADIGTNFRLYDISLYLDGKEQQPQNGGKVKVSIPVPAGMDGARASVYRIEDSGGRTLMESALNGGYLTFQTDHFSLYAIVERYATPGTGSFPLVSSVNVISVAQGNAAIVKLNTAGGTSRTAKVGDKLSKVKKPVKKGYTFKGWYTKAKAGSRLAGSYVIKKSSKIYAQWTAKKFKVLYNANKGKLKGKKYKTVTYDSKYGKLAAPTREGYKFSGWYTKAKGGVKITTGSKVHILKATKLYAHWKK
ncbi:MAG: InlB B-repeat-containing protein [Clostridiales Family XIII bacterium]|jgi:uncharacterized repeat protein (TIGR02543 family)|nr:InlB B-repeat-containing protein [Clostridiales Family XIII bacterium]